jgi:hypothetical protein
MSSWYVFSALGFYPVCPGKNYYVIGSPVFPEAIINLENGRKFIIKTRNFSGGNKYIQSASLNNKIYHKSYLLHQDILQGGEMVFEMGPKPGPHWGKSDTATPSSRISEYPITAAPVIKTGGFTFKDSQQITLTCLTPGAEIYYTTDGSDPDQNSRVYLKPFRVNKTTTLKAYASKQGYEKSKIIRAKLVKSRSDKTIRLNTRYSNQYTGGGESALIDTLTGTSDFRTGSWQGYFGKDLDAQIDLLSKRKISRVSIRCLQNARSWIFFPRKIILLASKDGANYQKVKELNIEQSQKEETPAVKEFSLVFSPREVRFIRLIAENIKRLPPWHISAGEKAWIFADEIFIN